MQRSPGASRARSVDVLVGGLLFGGTIVYLAAFAWYLDPQDEGLYLYEAVRILKGDVFFRDIFEIITPGGQYFIAACFWLFGTSMTTGRIAMAVLHGITVVAVYGTCRTLGCRHGLAAAAGLSVIALFQPVWPIVSPHWITTMLSMLLLWIALYRPWAARPWLAGVMGVLCGLAIATQQHKGVAFTLGACLLLGVDYVYHRRDLALHRTGWLRARLSYLAAGIALVMVPLFGHLLLRAGFGPIRRALWDQPMLKYRVMNRPAPWGWVARLNRQLVPYTFPRLLAVLPAVFLIDLGRALASLRSADRARGWQLIALTLFGAVSVATVLYFPDFIHLAFIAPLCVVALAELVERMLRTLTRRPAWAPRLAQVLTACLLAALGVQLARNLIRSHRDYPVPMQTAFGRVDLPSHEQADHFALIRRLVQATDTKELFCYPALPSMYLIAGATNPTPYQILHPLYNFDEQLSQATDILEARRVPYVIIVTPFLKPGDPVAAYLSQHYEPVDGSNLLYRRKAS